MGTAIVAGVTDGAVLGLMALGLVLVYKATGVLNIAQGEIGTVAIYIAWVGTSKLGFTTGRLGPTERLSIPIPGLGLPIAAAALLALVFAALLGIAMERFVIRRLIDAPRLTLTVVTLGVSTMLGGLEFATWSERPQELRPLISGAGPRIAGIFVSPMRLLAIVVTIALGVALYLFFKRTLFGLGVLAAAQNAVSLRLTGMSLARVSMFTWASGGVLAALAGLILAPTIGLFHPFFMTLLLIPSLAAALLGGLNSLPGAFVGGLIVGVTQEVVRYFWASSVPGVEIAASFVLIMVILILRPRGLLGAEA
jgi:branched-chain amino acid transport system permease protein